MLEYTLTGLTLKLELFPDVFQPTTTTQMLGEQMVNLKGKTVLDLGCGAGPIAIAAALSGATKVYAVDIMDNACRATSKNAEYNNVGDCIDVRQGDLFEPVTGLKFDIILDDVSGMAEEVSRISPWYPAPIPTGGPDGTVPTVRMLHDSRDYLTENGYLIFPVISLARTKKILSAAREIYGENVYKVASKMIPFNQELIKNIDVMERLKQEGIVNFIKKRSRYLWNLEIFRAEA